jgi:Tfp pilus assembly protein PilX
MEQKVNEERDAKKALTNAQAASQKAEEDTKTSAAKDAREAQAKAREQKLKECMESPAYKLWQASLKVEQGERMISGAQKTLDHDDAVVQESGIADLASRRRAGQDIVAGKTLVEDAFAAYKKLGGTASSPEEVKAGPDPCQEYR